MLGPVADGGHIVWNSTPGCWGPMITPAIRGGHEVCTPVAVEGAEVGDAIAIRIKDIAVTSLRDRRRATTRRWRAASTATRTARAVCPGCGAEWPETRLEGIGETAVRCAACGADATPFTFTNGYTIAFDERAARRDASTRRARRGARARRRARRRAARQLGPEPDPDVRAARHRRARHAACGRSSASSARRRRRRSPTPTTRATSARSSSARRTVRARRAGAAAAQDRRPPRHRRGARRRGARLPGQGAGRRRLPRRHARDAGRRRDRRPHRRRRRHGHAAGRGASRGSGSTGRCCSRSPRTCRSWPSR